MHELVIVSGIIDALMNLSERENRRIRSFTVSVGELASFDKNLIDSLIRELRKGTPLEDAEYRLVIEKAEVRCRTCSHISGFNDLIMPLKEDEREMIHFLPELVSSFTQCPSCGSRDLEIESGRGIKVVDIELE